MSDETIRVICRFRPQNKIEKAKNGVIVVRVSDCHTACEVTHPDKQKQPKPLTFNFDCIFDWTSTQLEVFEYSAKHLVEQIFEGFNATIFAYGQTGAGKTYSMEGELGSPHRGIVPRTVETIFETIINADAKMEYLLQISYCEIYLEMLQDLLNPRNTKMKIRDGKHGVYVEGITEMYVRDSQEVIDYMTLGAGNRTVSGTNMNAVSSRSHGVFMLKLTQTNTETGSKRISKLKMIDLAGCEKVSKTGARGRLLEEAKKINQSLSALGNVMGQLTTGGHVSYRDSVLTRLLSDSLGGNCKTTLLIAVSPSSFNCDETITTCRFGVRAKKIKNKAKINAEKTVAEYKVEVAALTAKILQLQTLVRALQHDLSLAKHGELGDDDRGQSDDVLDAVDFNDIMSDGTKKKKGKKKKKGFVRAGFEDIVAAQKASKKKKKRSRGAKKTDDAGDVKEDGDSGDVDIDEATIGAISDGTGTDDEKQASPEALQEKDQLIREANERADAAEDKIRYLEAELIKAQAAAAMGTGLAGAAPLSRQSSARRPSLLPAPVRPQDLENDAPSVNADLLRMASMQSNRFELEIGNMQSQKHAPETEFVYKMPAHLAELDPALLEQARRGLQQENHMVRRQMDVMIGELDASRGHLETKTEQMRLQKEKLADAEMECDRLLLQHQLYEERIESLEQSRGRSDQEVNTLEDTVQFHKKEIQRLKQNLTDQQRKFQKKIYQIQESEKRRADEFVKQAARELKRRHMNEERKGGIRKGKTSAYRQIQQGAIQNTKQLNRKRNAMESQMQTMKEETFRALQTIKMEQMKLQQMLQKKIEEYIEIKISSSVKDEEIEELRQLLKLKDTAMNRITRDLKNFGDMKLMSDRVHQQDFQKAQLQIRDLKKQLTKLQQMNNGVQRGGWERFGYKPPKSNVQSAIINQKRQYMPIPIRGGGNQKSVQQPIRVSNLSVMNVESFDDGGSVTDFFNRDSFRHLPSQSTTSLLGRNTSSQRNMYIDHSRQNTRHASSRTRDRGFGSTSIGSHVSSHTVTTSKLFNKYSKMNSSDFLMRGTGGAKVNHTNY